MALTALDNLVRIGQLKAEPRNDSEVQRMLAMAQTRWADAQLAHVSQEGRFTSAYNAAHTVNWPPARRRVLDAAHQKRNLAEYEGYLEIEESTIAEMVTLAAQLIADVRTLVGTVADRCHC